MTELGWPDGPTETHPDAPLGWPGETLVSDDPTEATAAVTPTVDLTVPDYRPIDLATSFGGPALPPTPLPEPIERIRAVLANDANAIPHTTVTGLDEDTPIGIAAAAAVRVLNPGGRDDFPKPAHRRILTVANQKGGVGKTTTTVNLAAALALHGCQVLVIDLDPQGNASTGMGVEHHAGVPSIYDVLLDNVPIVDVVQPATGLPNLRCVPATIDLAGAEIELVSVVARESRLQRAIAAYCDGPGSDVDYVLVDCPPSLGLLTLNAMVATEEVLIPIQCEYYALEGLGQLLKTVDLVKANLNPKLSVSTILLTMYDARTKLADQVVAEVRGHFGDIVLTSTIPRSVRVSEAPGYGQSVVTYDPGSRGSIAYLEAAREIATRGAEQ
jgi:chromosome partitioning protein